MEKDQEAREVMRHAEQEEFIHFGIDLEFLLRHEPTWRKVLQNILFQNEDLVKLAQKAEKNALNT